MQFHFHDLFERTQRAFTTILVGVILLSACVGNQGVKQSEQSASTHPDVLASFLVELPEPLPAETQLSLAWVDPLNAHDLNPSYQTMQSVDELHYQLDVPAKKGMLLQYRYVRTGKASEIELGANGIPLSSRFYYISSHSQIQDTILGFSDLPSKIPTGRIEGKVKNSGSQGPADGVLVTAAGITAVTAIDGHFRLEGVPAGTQNLTIFSPDGSLEPFEQQAVVENGNTTPIDVSLELRKVVNVTFIVNTPGDTPPSAKLRLFGNLTSLGDSFAGLFGGTNLLQNRALVLTKQTKNEYLVVVQLPIDSEIRYLYSLGDTFWNRETSATGIIANRTLFVAQQDMIIEDKVESWKTPNFEPITFQFTPPAETLNADQIQIQFNAFGWMDPLEMWPVGDGTYEFVLSNPLNFSTPVNYRFCRSEICGVFNVENQAEQLQSFQAKSTSQILTSTGVLWPGLTLNTEPTTVTTETSSPRTADFHTIVELTDAYRPSWLPYFGSAMDAALGLNANTLILPVTWTYASANPVCLTLNLSQNPSDEDIRAIVNLAKEKGYQVYLMAVAQYPSTAKDFWNQFSKDSAGWDQWFEAIFDFYHATALLAQETKADGIIFGDENISSIIGKTNQDSGIMDSYPEDGSQKWMNIFAELQKIFSGKTLLAVNFNDMNEIDREIFKNIGGVYFINVGKVSDSVGEVRTYTEQIAQKLDENLEPFFMETGKIIWLGMDFPSVASAHLGCIDLSGNCMVPYMLNYPSPAQPDIEISLQEQSNLYNAFLPEANRRSWVNGISTRRYLVLGNYQDQSSSIRGKPASDIIWYWFSTMMGIPTQ